MSPAVIDKYFMADGNAERFQYLTARAICGRCAVRAQCLVDAINLPTPSVGIRGGESADTIIDLHRRMVRGEGTAEGLALRIMATQPPHRGAGMSPSLRAGRFPNMPLLGSERGVE